MPYRKINYQYKGYTYRPYDDVEPDNIKTWHIVVHDKFDVEVGEIPLSPYSNPSEECFRAWIDSGLPSREQVNAAISGNNMCNPSEQDIINYYIEHILVKNET